MANDTRLQLNRKEDEIKVEKFELNLEIADEDEIQLQENPRDFITNLLEHEGHEVRKLRLSRELRQNPLRMKSDPYPGCYHIVYPESESSLWWCE